MIEGAYYDPSAFALMKEFASTLKLSKSTASGQPEEFVILPYAEKFFANLLGWKRANGARLFRKAYWSMARKNAKTTNIALLGLMLLIFDQEAQPEVYIAATEVEQAGECYEAAKSMVESNPDLADYLRIIDYKKMITCPTNGGILKALSSKGKGKHGSNPSAVIFDELHAWGPEHQELYDALTTGSGARRQPLRVMITTAGSNENSLCFEEYSYAKKVLNGTVQDPTYLADIHELPRDADWTDESLWSLPNPAIDFFPSMRQHLREECGAALNSPAKQNAVRRLYMNQWTASSEQWIPLHVWDQNAGPVNEEALVNVPAYGGLDLGATGDLTAFVLLWPHEGNFHVKPWFFLPEKDLIERSRRDGVRYDLWAKDGLIELTPGSVTDWTYVTDRISQLRRKFNIKQIAFDRYGARDTATRLQEESGDPEFVIQWGQGYLDMSPACKRLEEMALSCRIRHGGHLVLRWNVDCCPVLTDAAGNIKPDHPKRHRNSKRIDGVNALAMAVGVQMRAAVSEITYTGLRSVG